MRFHPFSRALLCSFLFAYTLVSPSPAQQAPKKSSAKASPESEVPAQIELLETRVRFETNGDSRKEVHAIVHILSELGAHQFGRLTFDYNRSFQSVEIPQAHISHPEGGTSDILPSAITDQANPATEGAPAYADVRVKSVRILGLSPGDTLEYRVITTTSHHPLAPDFWLDHSFDRSGVVSHEVFELDLPASRHTEIRINPATPPVSTGKFGEADAARSTYRWELPAGNTAALSPLQTKELEEGEPDVALSTLEWEMLSIRLDEQLMPGAKPLEKIEAYEESEKELLRKRTVSQEIAAKALDLTKGVETSKDKLEAIYDFVSQKIATIDLPLGSTEFAARSANEVLTAGYATQEDKFVLFAALATAVKLSASGALTGYCDKGGVARPSVFKHLLIRAGDGKSSFWLDPSLEVAPFGMISSIPQKCVFVLNRAFYSMNSTGHEWQPFARKLPFSARQKVDVDASLTSDGKLAAKVHYSLRGDNELLLRVAFHQTPKEKWKELAQLLSISDGFRGQVTSVNASDPYATREPFSVDYEITEPKFLDWSKKPLRVPALLPQLGLPDPPGKAVAGAAPAPIDLGTPLEAEIRMTLHLPPGSTIFAPTGTSVQRDYATFTSRYSAEGQTATAIRHIRFIARQLPAERAFDLNAFLRAVQTDEGQTFILDRQNPATPASSPKP